MSLVFRACGGGGYTVPHNDLTTAEGSGGFAPNPTCCSSPRDLCPRCKSEARRLRGLEYPPDPYRAATQKALSADFPENYDRLFPPDGYAIAVARMRREGR